jgi:hypothetical protein
VQCMAHVPGDERQCFTVLDRKREKITWTVSSPNFFTNFSLVIVVPKQAYMNSATFSKNLSCLYGTVLPCILSRRGYRSIPCYFIHQHP